MAQQFPRGNINPMAERNQTMTGNIISPVASKAIAPAVIVGGNPKMNTFTLDNTTTPKLQEIKVLHYRATSGVKVHFNSDLHGPPEKYFMAEEGVFAVNSSMKSVHFTANPITGPTTIYFECE